MIDERAALERALRQFPAEPGIVERVHDRRRRAQRNQRIGAAVVTVAVISAVAVVLAKALNPPALTPAHPKPSPVAPMPIPPLLHNGRITVSGYFGGLEELSSDGSVLTRLMRCHGSCTEISRAAWTPDGNRIAFIASCGGGCASAGDPYHGIRVLDVRTGTDRLLAAGDMYTAVAWSPDGSKIGYAVRPAEGLEGVPAFLPKVPGGGLFVMNADGTSPIELPGVNGWIDSLSWSPDGTSILYSSPSTRAMYEVRLGGFKPTSLGPGEWPVWSPDGTRFAYTEGVCTVLVGRPNGNRSVILDLSQSGSGCGFLTTSGPVWSPDGTQLAVVVGKNLWVIGADGSNPHVLHHGVSGWESIAWRPVP